MCAVCVYFGPQPVLLAAAHYLDTHEDVPEQKYLEKAESDIAWHLEVVCSFLDQWKGIASKYPGIGDKV